MLIRNWVVQHNYMPEMHRFLTPMDGGDDQVPAAVGDNDSTRAEMNRAWAERNMSPEFGGQKPTI